MRRGVRLGTPLRWLLTWFRDGVRSPVGSPILGGAIIPRASQVVVSGGAFVAIASILVARPASAQGRRFEIAPAVGTYLPTRQLPFYPWVAVPLCGGCTQPAPPQQNHAVAAGGSITAWLINMVGVNASLMYAPSGVRVYGFLKDTPGVVSSGSVVVASLRAVVRLAPKAAMMSVLIMGGPAMIHRSGSYYYDVAPVQGTTSFGSAVGVGLDIRPGHRVGIRATIEDYLYPAQFASGTSFYTFHPSERKPQQDFLISLSISPFRRPRANRR
jgi:hypothetical protein